MNAPAIPSPRDATAQRPSIETCCLTLDPDIAAACGPFGVGVVPNTTIEIRNGSEFLRTTGYNLSATGTTPLLGLFQTRKIINAWESGELCAAGKEAVPFVFAMLALKSLPAMRNHLKLGHSASTRRVCSGSPASLLQVGAESEGEPSIVENADIIRTEMLPVALALAAVGARFLPELTCASAGGLHWMHFEGRCQQFEPGKVASEPEVEVDLRHALMHLTEYPRLGVAVGAVIARAQMQRWEREGEIWLFRDKARAGDIRAMHHRQVDSRRSAFVRRAQATQATLDVVGRHLRTGR